MYLQLSGHTVLDDANARTTGMLRALAAAFPTVPPPPPSVLRRCVPVILTWLFILSVSLAVGFQFDPARSGPAPFPLWVSVPSGILLAMVATWFAFGYVRLVRLNAASTFLPGESKVLLRRRDWRFLDRLRLRDHDADAAVTLWLRQGFVFGEAQLDALVSCVGPEIP